MEANRDSRTGVVIDFAKAVKAIKRKQAKSSRKARATVGAGRPLTLAQSIRRDEVRAKARAAL